MFFLFYVLFNSFTDLDLTLGQDNVGLISWKILEAILTKRINHTQSQTHTLEKIWYFSIFTTFSNLTMFYTRMGF